MMLDDLTGSWTRHVSEFKRCRILVLGDAILDEYLLGECNRISPEAPVPVVKVTGSRHELGGAANTAANIVSLGGRATLIALTGADSAGATLRRRATEVGVNLLAVDHGRATLRKVRVVGQQQQIVRLDYEDAVAPARDVEAAILAKVDASIAGCQLIVISDYAKGFLTPALSTAIVQRARRHGCRVIVDPRPQNRACYSECDYLTPNWKESRALLGLADAEATPEEAASVAGALAASLATNVVLTLGAQGIRFCSKDGIEQFALPTMAREVFDVSGAGDTVTAAFALSIAAGADHATAIAIANRAASIVVGKFGTATVTAEELLQETDALRLVPRHALPSLAAALRAKGRRIVAVDGSFDILHADALRVLTEARAAGDVLVVGLNSDTSVRARKGPGRPFVPERQRATLLLGLRAVDFVHIFDEIDPTAFLHALNPDVHVNGADVLIEEWDGSSRFDFAAPRITRG